ncbi:MAG: DUF4743 domain-containing protein [Alphaproteobacteria bacterium]|nr:DUF4743 domain-containing protein [Alphaproteobacteria bacterium]
MAFIDHVRFCNTHDLRDFVPFRVGQARVGMMRRGFSMELRRFGALFHVFEDLVHLDPRLTTYEDRTKAVDEALSALSEDGLLPRLRGERYPVMERLSDPPVFEIDRAAATAFGIINRGFHLNGIVGGGDDARMWVARRAWDKSTYPGHLDNVVAGGHPVGHTAEENLIKECAEEAGIAEPLARRAVPVGMVSYVMEVADGGPSSTGGEMGGGLRRHAFWAYDLDLPEDFRPKPVDGEVAEFMLLPWREVADIVERGPIGGPEGFKYNCNLVVIDWLLRTGRIAPDHPDYLDLCTGLHAVFP